MDALDLVLEVTPLKMLQNELQSVGNQLTRTVLSLVLCFFFVPLLQECRPFTEDLRFTLPLLSAAPPAQ